jgi:hypothetical protein
LWKDTFQSLVNGLNSTHTNSDIDLIWNYSCGDFNLSDSTLGAPAQQAEFQFHSHSLSTGNSSISFIHIGLDSQCTRFYYDNNATLSWLSGTSLHFENITFLKRGTTLDDALFALFFSTQSAKLSTWKNCIFRGFLQLNLRAHIENGEPSIFMKDCTYEGKTLHVFTVKHIGGLSTCICIMY